MSIYDDILAVADVSDIEIGLSVTQLESGKTLSINGDVPFPMASVFKIPILTTAFHQLEQGYALLDDRRTLCDDQKSAGSGILPFFNAGLAPTWLDLLTLMIIISDNTATDMVIERLGGVQVIESYMHEIGLHEIYFKMNCKDLLRTAFPEGAQDVPLEELEALIIEKGFNRDSVAFSVESDNNVSTPSAMTRLLTMIFNAEITERKASDEMLSILLKQQYNDRLPRFLPPGTKCAHKTGTIGGIRNDSGIFFISDDNHVAITLFVRWDDEAVWLQPEKEYARVFEVETAMGRIGRLVYDHFLLQRS
jgi:beta-lactamase class A